MKQKHKALFEHFSGIFPGKNYFFSEKIKIRLISPEKLFFSWKTKTNSKKLEIQSAETGENINIR